MKFITLLTIFFLISCCTNRVEKKTSNHIVTNKIQDNNSINLEEVFGHSLKYLKDHKISINKQLICLYKVDNEKKVVIIRPSECKSYINDFITEKFELLEINNWLEEALSHKDLYYKKEEYIVIFDMVKYCKSKITTDFFIETIRVFKKEEYYSEALKTGSVKYFLKEK